MRRRSRVRFAALLGVSLSLAWAGQAGRAQLEGPPLQPTYLGMDGLETALRVFSAASEGDPPPPFPAPAPTLRPGDRGDAVVTLRARLVASGEAALPAATDLTLFDAELEAAVRAFQHRHGLEVEGKVGRATRAELALEPADRVEQIQRTMASRCELPVDLGHRFLLLNLPAFELAAIEGGRPALVLRVVLGTADQPTPTLVSAVHRMVINPTWNVPTRIARGEIAPLVQRDPDYLARLGFEIVSAAPASQPIAPADVDWAAFRRGELELLLRQRPGPQNALGRVSFQFANPANVCLHDTPARHLFARARRTFSHGCIRVERPLELAGWLLRDEPEQLRQALDDAWGGAETQWLSLTAPVPIYLVDWPVWVAADGILQMRPEIYPERAGRRAGARSPPEEAAHVY